MINELKSHTTEAVTLIDAGYHYMFPHPQFKCLNSNYQQCVLTLYHEKNTYEYLLLSSKSIGWSPNLVFMSSSEFTCKYHLKT